MAPAPNGPLVRNPIWTWWYFATLEQNGRVSDLREAFEESNLPFRVDLFVWDAVPEQFRKQIKREHMVLVGARRHGGSSEGSSTPPCKQNWCEMPFTKAFLVNPSVQIERGSSHLFVDMATVNPGFRSVHSSEVREFRGSGSRFQDGDTLMARITPCLENGKIARYCAHGTLEPAHGSTEFIVVRPDPAKTVQIRVCVLYALQVEIVRATPSGSK